MARLLTSVDIDTNQFPDEVREASAENLSDPTSVEGLALRGVLVDQARTGILIPAVVDYATLQAALVSAATFGTKVVAAGAITTNQTLTVTSSADLGGLVYNYTGSGVAVQLGSDSSYLNRATIIAPQVINTLKTGTDWSTVTGSTGIRAVNLSACPLVSIPYVNGFDTNLLIYGAGKGHSYNNYLMGQLHNGRTNMKLDADATGWANQNQFNGGRFSIDSGHGTNVAGVCQLLITAGLANPVNNNTWTGTSFEGSVAAYMLRAAGTANQFNNCRWEGAAPKVQWQSGAIRNVISGGYNVNNIVEEAVGTMLGNTIYGVGAQYMDASTKGLLVLENTSGASSPGLAVMPPNSRGTGADPATAYALQFSANFIRAKRTGDANDRCQIDAQNGRIYFANGAAVPSYYLGNFGTTSIGISGGHFAYVQDNTYDLGIASQRPRYVRAGTAVVTGAVATGGRPTAATAGAGAMMFDTTLNKPIWSTGSAWVDATGATV